MALQTRSACVVAAAAFVAAFVVAGAVVGVVPELGMCQQGLLPQSFRVCFIF